MKHYKTRKKIINKLSNKSGLPFDAMLGLPYIKINGQRELMIEGNCKIVEFENKNITAKCKNILIKIKGGNLNIDVLEIDTLLISGTINSVEFEDDL